MRARQFFTTPAYIVLVVAAALLAAVLGVWIGEMIYRAGYSAGFEAGRATSARPVLYRWLTGDVGVGK